VLLVLASASAAPADQLTDVPEDATVPRATAHERLGEIQRRVQAVALYPEVARARAISGETLVAFTIHRDGTPEGVRVARSSGSVALDRAAERAVSDAAPLPWVYGEVSVPVSFVLRDAP
jgi:TonB family protein